MDAQEVIYKHLWDYGANETLAKEILHDSAVFPSLRAIAHYLLHDYRGFKELSAKDNENPKDVFWLEVRLISAYLQCLEQNKSIDDLRSEVETLTSLEHNFVFSRLLLATILARQREHQKSISTFESILSISPSNLSAWVGLIGTFILAKQPQHARNALRKALRVAAEITDIKKRIYWQVIFFIYGFRVYIERSILTGLVMLALPFFPPLLSRIVLIIGLVTFLPLVLLTLQKKDSWALSILTRLFISALISWLIGYGAKFLFVFVEGM